MNDELLILYACALELLIVLCMLILIVLSWLFNKMQEKRLKLVQDRIYQLSDKKDYGVCPSPVDDSEFVKEMTKYFLGDDWYVVDSISHGQVNHEALIQIEMKYKGVKQKYGK